MRTRIFWLVLLLVLVFAGASCAGKKEGKDTPGTPAGGGLPAIQPRAAGLPEIAGITGLEDKLVFSREDTPDWQIVRLRDSSRPGIM